MSAHSYYRSDYPCGRSWYRTVKCKNLESYTYRMGSIVSHPVHWTHKGSPGWYKSLPERFRQRSKVTVCLSAVYLLTSATGLILILHRENAGTHLGILHYQAGILFGILAIWHLCGRMKILLTMRKHTEKRPQKG